MSALCPRSTTAFLGLHGARADLVPARVDAAEAPAHRARLEAVLLDTPLHGFPVAGRGHLAALEGR